MVNEAPCAETPDEAFQAFSVHWTNHAAEYQLHRPEVREKLITMVASTMVLLRECPEVFDTFIARCAQAMDASVPDSVKQRVYDAVQEEGAEG